jgi:hypothetical protein
MILTPESLCYAMPMQTSASLDTSQLHSQRRFYFSLGALLFIVLCFAGLFAGYRIGFNRGYTAGELKYAGEQPVHRSYEVEDLVKLPDGRTDFDSLQELITTTIEPNSWDDVGGIGTIKEFETNSSFVILQREDVHAQIEKLFADLRAISKRTAEKNAASKDDSQK